MHPLKPRYYLLTGLYCAGIFWMSSKSLDELPQMPLPGLDKAVHMVLYGGLAAVVSLGIRRSGKSVRPAVQILAPLGFCLLYGLSDEIHQSFIPNRSFDLLDLAADGGGAAAVQAVLCGWCWKIESRMGFGAGETP